jgi:hypothetical protein
MLFGVLVNPGEPLHEEESSAGLKPLPVTATFPPADTKLGLSVILGAELVTVNVA